MHKARWRFRRQPMLQRQDGLAIIMSMLLQKIDLLSQFFDPIFSSSSATCFFVASEAKCRAVVLRFVSERFKFGDTSSQKVFKLDESRDLPGKVLTVPLGTAKIFAARDNRGTLFRQHLVRARQLICEQIHLLDRVGASACFLLSEFSCFTELVEK